MQGVADYYEAYEEDSRLQTNQARRLEFLTTTAILNRYMKAGDRIMDAGAGTGIYSFYYGERGHQVTAVDLTPKHIQMIQDRQSAKPHVKVEAHVGDATDLSPFGSDVFDAVLCLGPMYHLTSVEAQKRCLRECLRVLKPGGIIAAAYISRLFIVPYLVKGNRKFLSEQWIGKLLTDGAIHSSEEDCFWTDAYFHTPEEMEERFRELGVEKLTHAATDGIAPFMSQMVDGFSETEFQVWADYHLRTCTEPSLLGMSNHGLLVGKKG